MEEIFEIRYSILDIRRRRSRDPEIFTTMSRRHKETKCFIYNRQRTRVKRIEDGVSTLKGCRALRPKYMGYSTSD